MAKKSRLNILDVLLVSFVLSLILFFVLREVFWYVGGFTLVLFLMYIVLIWDDIVIWFSTRK